MGSGELISVIVPIYKVEKYLNKCIQSIVNQTYQNLEIILVDDGSPDQCPRICDEWAQKDSRIKVIHKENGGLSSARNSGIQIAQGQYIGFVDSDDYIAEEMYMKLYSAMKIESADLAICSYELVTEEGKIIESQSPVKNEFFSGKEGLGKLFGAGEWYYVTAWNKLYDRKLLENIKFPVGKIHEDEFVVHKIFWACNKIVTIEQKMYKYVQRSGSIMTSKNEIKSLDMIEAFCERLLFYKKHELDEYVSKFLPVLKNIYICKRLSLFRMHNWYDGKRIRSIDKMFRNTYFVCKRNISIEEKLLYVFPIMLFLYQKMNGNKIRGDLA